MAVASRHLDVLSRVSDGCQRHCSKRSAKVENGQKEGTSLVVLWDEAVTTAHEMSFVYHLPADRRHLETISWLSVQKDAIICAR